MPWNVHADSITIRAAVLPRGWDEPKFRRRPGSKTPASGSVGLTSVKSRRARGCRGLRTVDNVQQGERLGNAYGEMGESDLSAENISIVYRLRDRVSDREKFFLKLASDFRVTGNLEKAQQTCESLAQTYPRAMDPHNKADKAAMEREVSRAQKGSAGDLMSDKEAFVEAHPGHVQQSRKLAQRAVGLAQ